MLTKSEYQHVIAAIASGLDVTHDEVDIHSEEIVVEALMRVDAPYDDKVRFLEGYFTGEINLNVIAEFIIRTENISIKI